MEVGIPTDINGVPYNDNCTPQISLEINPDPRPSWATDVFVVFRGYMEPETAVSPDRTSWCGIRRSISGPTSAPV